MQIDLKTLKNEREIKFSIELDHTVFKKDKELIKELVESGLLKKYIYKELSGEEIAHIFLDENKTIKGEMDAGDVLEAICDMNGVDFIDGEIKELDSASHHGKQARDDIQKQKELEIKDLSSPDVSGPAGPDR